MKHIYKFIAICLLFIVGCNEDQFLLENPKDAIYAENLYESNSGFISSMSSVYSMMRLIKDNQDDSDEKIVKVDNRGVEQLWVMNTDNVSTRSSTINKFEDISPAWTDLYNAYSWLYKIVNTTNMIISRAEGDVDWEATNEEDNLANKNAIIAQASIARAWSYRLLIYSFGPVPLSTEEVTGATYHNAWERNSMEDIKTQMVTDLTFAVQNLPIRSGNNETFNSAVARHYLGELYLSMGQFQEAVDILQPLCESGEYGLVTGRFGRTSGNADGNLFTDIIRNPFPGQGNSETLFVFANGLALPGSESLSLMQAWTGEYRKYKKLIGDKEELFKKNGGDTIFSVFTYRTDDQGYPNWNNKHGYVFTRKWEVDDTETNDWFGSVCYKSVGYIRLAETYLLYAEALYMNGNSGGAAMWINYVRERSGASTIDAADVTIDFILDERARELIGEEERRISLLRTGKYIERVKKYNPCSMYYIQDFHKLYPFPADAIDANKDKVIEQNAGWGGSITVDFTPTGYPDEGLN
jgi:tetratricopeptide (TPR) repeat protein